MRLINYDRIPGFTETQDEFFYPWAGMTMITTGVPVAWSWFPSYEKREIVTYWGAKYPLVTPWIEKPPLFSLLSGVWVLWNRQTQLNEVRLSTIRLVPVSLGTLTIFLTGILGVQLFGKKVAIIGSILYATVPPIVLSNRLSLTENLLTPFMLLTNILLFIKSDRASWKWLQPVITSLVAAAAVNSKNIGLIAPFIVIIFYTLQKKWIAVIIALIIGGIGLSIHPLIGLYYNWNLYVHVLNQYRISFISEGLPQLIHVLFTYPVITTKDRLLPDGIMFVGFILLFSAPLWLFQSKSYEIKKREYIFLAFPLLFLVVLNILASGAGYSFYGWHIFPLFPYIAILAGFCLIRFYESP